MGVRTTVGDFVTPLGTKSQPTLRLGTGLARYMCYLTESYHIYTRLGQNDRLDALTDQDYQD